jgi:hypothetical protein
VTAGEGIACRRLHGSLYGKEGWILDPGTGDPTKDLQKLIDHRSDETDTKKIISLVFVKAPEYDHTDRHKYRFFATSRD